jgi:fibronectin-binding autotransporter adhesin
MATHSWVRNLFGGKPRTVRSSPARQRLSLEALEDRLAPATLTVNSTANTASATDPYLSLGEAIAIVNSATLPTGLSAQITGQISGALHAGGTDTIVFDDAKVTEAITLGGTQLELSLPSTTATITIEGGAAGVTVDGNKASRIFQVDSGVQATLENLTLKNGSGGSTNLPLGIAKTGGGIYNAGTLTVSDCTLAGNSSGYSGGGIYCNGTVTVSDCTLSGNSAYSGGGISNGGKLTVSDCTLSGNSATNHGGGISNGGTLTVSDCTLSGNSADFGGGIDNLGTLTVSDCTLSGNSAGDAGGCIYNKRLKGYTGTVTLNNSIVANSSSGGDVHISSGTITGSNNLIEDGSGGGGLSHTLTGDPKLGPLASNGGPTQTLALLPDSPAIDKGDNSLAKDSQGNPLTTDQRGYSRISGAAVDLGAYEVQQPSLSPATLPNGTYGTFYSQALTATEAGYAGSFTFAVSAGALPAGLSLAGDGRLSGTPAAAGSFSFTVTATDSAGFTGGREYTVVIAPASLSVTADGQGMTYGGSVPALTYQYTGLVNGDTSASFTGGLATAATGGSYVGSYDITQGDLAATGNYTIGTFTKGTLKVNPADLYVTATANSKTYGQTASDGGAVTGVVNNDGITATFSSPGDAATAGVGKYTISASLSDPNGKLSNYTVHEADATLTVTPATLTVTADNASRIYGIANPAFTASYSGFVNGQDLAGSGVTGSPSLTTVATPTSLPGAYAITAARGTLAAANYAFAFAGGTLTVNPDTLTGGGLGVTTPLGAPFAGDVAAFTDDNPNALPGDFTASIDWGDGQASAGSVRAAGGGFAVSGGHTYTSPGPFTISVQLQAAGVSPATFAGAATVGSDAVIPGTGGDDSLVLTRTGGGGAGDVTYALNGAAPVRLSGVTSFTFDGLGGDDTFTVDYRNGPPLLGGGIAFDGGPGANALVVDDSAGTAATTLTVTDAQVITRDSTASVSVRYLATGGSIGSVAARTGAGADTALVQSTLAGATTAINTGSGDDVLYVSSAVGTGGTLDGLRGPLVLDAGAGSNFLVVSAAGGGPDTLTLTGSSISDTAGLSIAYQASGGSFAGVNLATGPGDFRVYVQSTAAGAVTGVLNLGGDDTVDVCSDTATNMGDLGGLKGTLLVEALGGTDLLVASEAGRRDRDDVLVTATGLGSRDGAGFTINYAAAGGTFSGINFASGSGADRFTVLGAPAGVPLALYTWGGGDAVVVGVTADSGYDLTVDGRAPGGGPGGAALGVADLSGSATVQSVAAGPDSGLVRALYAGRKPSTVAYSGVDQLFTSPPAG